MIENLAQALLTIKGQDMTKAINPRLISLNLSEKRDGEADQLDIVIHDHDGLLAIPSEGDLVTLAIGWKSGALVKSGWVDKGKFKIDDVEWAGPPDTLTIRARSADFTDAFRVRSEKKRKDTTVGAIIADIASANGLKSHVAAELASIAVPVADQDQRSDMALMRRLGRRHDAVATVKNGTLLFMPIGKGLSAAGRPLPPFALVRPEIARYRWARPAREEYGGVEARWHDKSSAKRKTVTHGGDSTDDGAGKKKRKPKRLHRTYHTEADAKHAAEAEHKRISRAAATLEVDLALGRADLYPERRGRIIGFKPEIDDATWLIAESTHTLDGSGGFQTKLKCELAI
ncbi:MAG: contractile injection system protein, VgrG/Pvc8 family [Bacillota bacterium]